jgi:hypothetical protein
LAEVDRLLDVFVGKAYGMESGLSHKADLDRDNYDAIASVIDPGYVNGKLKERYPDLSGANFPYGGKDIGQRLAEQFAFVHRKAAATTGETKTDVPRPDSEGESADD